MLARRMDTCLMLPARKLWNSQQSQIGSCRRSSHLDEGGGRQLVDCVRHLSRAGDGRDQRGNEGVCEQQGERISDLFHYQRFVSLPAGARHKDTSGARTSMIKGQQINPHTDIAVAQAGADDAHRGMGSVLQQVGRMSDATIRRRQLVLSTAPCAGCSEAERRTLAPEDRAKSPEVF